MQIAEGMWTRGTETPPAWHRVLDLELAHQLKNYLLEFTNIPETSSPKPSPIVHRLLCNND